MRWWKMLGLAGVAGVAASGAVIARAERRRRAYTPDEIRERLHARLAEASQIRQAPPALRPPASDGGSGPGR
ncbi:MAG TPA: hypothetical protein VF256_22465 [Streptosporangiaceae bacterium]|jgi:hypothetical protein